MPDPIMNDGPPVTLGHLRELQRDFLQGDHPILTLPEVIKDLIEIVEGPPPRMYFNELKALTGDGLTASRICEQLNDNTAKLAAAIELLKGGFLPERIEWGVGIAGNCADAIDLARTEENMIKMAEWVATCDALSGGADFARTLLVAAREATEVLR